MTVRLFGLLLLVVGAGAVERLHHLAATLPQPDPSPAELVLSLVVALCGSFGALALAVGPALFRPCGRTSTDN